MSAWLGVVSFEHVRRAVSLGIAQIGHGKRAGLLRMHAGDTLIYYSSVERIGDRTPLQQFTAIAEIADDEIWQADEGDFKPFRRRARYLDTAPVELASVRNQLHLTAEANWGYQLRRNIVPLDEHDANLLRSMMEGGAVGQPA
ncbi:EVE domain-containing protein [Psychromicrobium sp. YIM B11713]|uniref:EVE domain-containing protein n=1 Tax=Psychromicrobium sp. YIM B11713 TaxID=3145233 RepID=UPI00374ED65C